MTRLVSDEIMHLSTVNEFRLTFCFILALMWILLPENTLAFKKENVYSGKKPKDRITVLIGPSMTGEKLPLLVIGPAKKNLAASKEF